MSYRITVIESFYPHTKAEPEEAGRVPVLELLVDALDMPSLLKGVVTSVEVAESEREERNRQDNERAARVPRVPLRIESVTDTPEPDLHRDSRIAGTDLGGLVG
jgi:hypothetical protein